MKLLEIQSSPRGESSDSITLNKSFIEALADLHASMNDVVRAIESEDSPLGDD